MVELALFGSLILLIFGTLLSYAQRQNDQQYIQMEAFRRALQRANTGLGPTAEGAGASAQVQLIENRRYSDLSGNFRKGSPQSLRASSNIFWAVPKGGDRAANVILLRVNDDEKEFVNSDTKVEDIRYGQTTSFSEISTKEETPAAITNTRTSKLKDTVTTNFLDKDGNSVWQVVQGVYRDSTGQYKYSSTKVDNEVIRGTSRRTEF